jgi:PAS domain S-box-containing protein
LDGCLAGSGTTGGPPAPSPAGPPGWAPRSELQARLKLHSEPEQAGRAVWGSNEPWIEAIRRLAHHPGVLLDELADWAALLDRHSTVQLEPTAAGTRVHWQNVGGVEADLRECAFRLGALAGLLETASQAAPRVRQVQCRARGDRGCVLLVENLQPRRDPDHAEALRAVRLLEAARESGEVSVRRLESLSEGSGDTDPEDLRVIQRLLESIEDPVLIFDLELSLLAANQAAVELMGVTLDELRALSARELLRASSYQALRQALPALLEAGSVRGLLLDVRGGHGWVELEVSARVSQDRQSLVFIGRDAGERLRLQAELAERNRQLEEQNERISAADRLKSEFLANVSHELTTPITCIKGFAKLMVGDLEAGRRGEPARLPDEKRIEFLKIMERESQRMTDLIRGLLELSRIESGVVTLDRARVSLNTIIRETLVLLKTRVDERSVAVELQLDPELPVAFLDPDRMKQVVLNLVENAVKFSEPGSTVLLKTLGLPESLRMSIRNSAPDVVASDLTRIFERFVQRDGTFARQHGGVGLGLNLVRAIVELHGGRIWGELPKRGEVEFVVDIPLAPLEAFAPRRSSLARSDR